MIRRYGVSLGVTGMLALATLCVAGQPAPEARPDAAATQPAASQPSGPPPRVELSPKVFDFGEIWQGNPPKKEFTIKNTGEGPLTLTVKSSCGCTVPTNPKSPLEPGGTTTFTITYDARAKGEAHKTITLMTNDPTQLVIPIEVKGNVKPIFECEPTDRLMFQDVEPGSPAATKTMKLINKYDRPVHLELKAGQDYGRFDIALKEIKLDEEYELTVTTKPPLRIGQNRVLLVLEPSVPGLAPITVYVFANAQPRIFPMPSALAVAEKETKPSEQVISVMYGVDKPIKVTGATSDLPGFKYEVLPVGPPPASGVGQGAARVRLTLPAYQDVPEGGGKIEILTDSDAPEYQKLEVRVMRQQTPSAVEQTTTRPAFPLPGRIPTTQPQRVPVPRPGGATP